MAPTQTFPQYLVEADVNLRSVHADYDATAEEILAAEERFAEAVLDARADGILDFKIGDAR